MKILCKAVLVTMVCFPGSVSGAVNISEIMYDIEGADAGREWIEVYNGSSADIDLSAWKLFEANVSHNITAAGSSVVPAGAWAIIADSPEKFTADNPGFSGSLFDSAFSLANGGEAVALHDSADAIVDQVSYEASWGAAGDGDTLQKTADGTWIAAEPTVGSGTVANASAAAGQSDNAANNALGNANDSANTAALSAHSSQAVATISYDEPEFIVTSGRSRLGSAGTPLSFEARIKTVKNIPVTARATYSWSMGDGTTENGQFVSHTYEFPGDYIVILNAESGGARAVSKVTVKIVAPKLLVRAGPDHIEIENSGPYELNIGGFHIETGGSRFKVAPDTLIAPKAKIRLSMDSMRLSYGKDVRIVNPAGKVAGEAVFPLPYAAVGQDVVISLPPGIDEDRLRERLRAEMR